MSTRKLLFGMVVVLASAFVLSACAPAPVDASKARSQAVIQSGGIAPAEELRVAEYLGYYKQNFPSPVNSTLGLDLRLGNMQIPMEGGPVWLQIGVQARSTDNDVVAPLNLAIVVDRSGSMDSPEKMPRLKESLRAFLRNLSPNDLVSLVAFNERAEVIAPATRLGDGRWIDSAIEKLRPGGNTNLNDGLMEGFQEVERNFDVRRNNRVILLTDGVANTGETNPDRIAESAKGYNDKGIYLSTIGLGRSEYNDALLIKLADQGKGAYHFVDTAAEIDRMFRGEVAGLFQKAASSVSVSIRPDPSASVESITGYDGRPPSGPIQVKLRDMGTGDSQVVLARLNLAPGAGGRRSIATVELRYQDVFSQRQEVVTQTVVGDGARIGNYDPTWDVEVLRNVTIQRTAEGLKEIDRLYKARRYQDAWQLAYGLEQDLRSVARLANDSQLVKDADTMRRYQDTLARWVQSQTGRPPVLPENSRQQLQPMRGRETSPDGPALEIR